MQSQLNIFLLLFGGLQGLLFSVFLFRKKLYQAGYIFLLFYLGAMLLQLTLKVMNKLWLLDNWPMLYTVSHYLPLLYGPLAFLFVKDIVEQKHLNSKVIFHFQPFFFIVLMTALVQSGIANVPFGNILYNPHIRLTILSASLITYHILAFRGWQQHRMSLEHCFSETRFIQMSWLRNFLLLSFITCSLVVVALYLLYINYPSGHEYRYEFTALTVFIYWITYKALKQPAIFSVIKGQAETANGYIPKLIVHRPVKKYARSTLTASEKKRICEALEIVIKKDKIYLDAELTIDRLAGKISCSRHILSQGAE